MPSFVPEMHEISLLVLGAVMLLAAWLSQALVGRAITFPALYIGVGALVFALPTSLLPDIDPRRHGEVAERITELAVIVSLMGAGLKIDRRFSWRSWSITWRLLAVTMPLTIAAVALLGWWALGLAPASAVLLGAALAPTDPVLASEVQVHAPGQGGEDAVRFSLTSEAGLNDGLAFPFTNMAIAMAIAGAAPIGWLGGWLAVDVVYKLAVGFLGGIAVGWVLGRLLFRSVAEGRRPVAQSMEGSLALAATFIAYSLVELANGYGFIAVFVAASVIRRIEKDHEYYRALHEFTENTERWLMVVLLLLLGGVSIEVLRHTSWQGFAVALAIVLLIRPASGLLALLGRGERWRERAAIGFFGIRGVGSLYYLAYAFNHAEFEKASDLWEVVVMTILLSTLLHGLSAPPVMRRLDAYRQQSGMSRGDVTPEPDRRG
jgi:sodium/hydrogen antiporter